MGSPTKKRARIGSESSLSSVASVPSRGRKYYSGAVKIIKAAIGVTEKDASSGTSTADGGDEKLRTLAFLSSEFVSIGEERMKRAVARQHQKEEALCAKQHNTTPSFPPPFPSLVSLPSPSSPTLNTQPLPSRPPLPRTFLPQVIPQLLHRDYRNTIVNEGDEEEKGAGEVATKNPTQYPGEASNGSSSSSNGYNFHNNPPLPCPPPLIYFRAPGPKDTTAGLVI